MTKPPIGLPPQRPVRVFISYSHDSQGHSDRVLSLAQRLRQDGLDAMLDQFVPFPREGWIRWMERQLDEADFTLCVCTEGYRVSFDGGGGDSSGRGVNWEGQTVSQCVYDNRGDNLRFIPVVFEGRSGTSVIPRALKPYPYFVLDRQYDELYRLLTNQPAVSPLPCGTVRELSVISPGVPDTPLPLDVAHSIDNEIRMIAAGPGGTAEVALAELERMVNYGDDEILAETAIRQLVSYISALDTSSSYPQEERVLRANVIRALIRLSGGKLASYFSGYTLSGVDLAMFDFRGADLSDTDFSGSFMIECDFRGVDLTKANFAGCYIRNVRFDGAVLDEVNFTHADWFNALGLDAAQLATCRTRSLMPCPLTEEKLFAYLDRNYGFPFSAWGQRVQQELRHTWATYLRPGGLAADVARWRQSNGS
jgi:SEFIR domain/Pentapeptide repeats (9 copies)